MESNSSKCSVGSTDVCEFYSNNSKTQASPPTFPLRHASERQQYTCLHITSPQREMEAEPLRSRIDNTSKGINCSVGEHPIDERHIDSNMEGENLIKHTCTAVNKFNSEQSQDNTSVAHQWLKPTIEGKSWLKWMARELRPNRELLLFKLLIFCCWGGKNLIVI